MRHRVGLEEQYTFGGHPSLDSQWRIVQDEQIHTCRHFKLERVRCFPRKMRGNIDIRAYASIATGLRTEQIPEVRPSLLQQSYDGLRAIIAKRQRFNRSHLPRLPREMIHTGGSNRYVEGGFGTAPPYLRSREA